ncbi:MAG: lysophospholipid acyltransferase family protein [Candidatus Omnitrophica bacterium]|nr:lysophospholipid acyltransferase family protein [Candidatus Omnitrophota bacterium]
MLYRLYVIGMLLARVLSLKAGYVIAKISANLYCFFAREDRRELTDNLRVVLGEDTPNAVIDEHVRGIFVNFAKYLADFFKFTRYTKEHIDQNIEIVDIENLDDALAEGNGAILLSLHLGNWELGAAIIASIGYPLSALVLEHADKRINDFFVKQRDINSMKVIQMGLQAGLRIKECFRVLKKNESLAIVGDKDYTSNGLEIEFFGKKAVLPKGPAVFALKTKAPIVFTVLTREKDDTFKFYFEKSIKCENTGDADKDIRGVMSEYIKLFEKYIRMYPDQWYAFKRLWKPDETIR